MRSRPSQEMGIHLTRQFRHTKGLGQPISTKLLGQKIRQYTSTVSAQMTQSRLTFVDDVGIVLMMYRLLQVKMNYYCSVVRWSSGSSGRRNTWPEEHWSIGSDDVFLLGKSIVNIFRSWWNIVSVFVHSGSRVDGWTGQACTESLSQRFPNCGPRTPRGPWGTDRGSARNYCFLVEFWEQMYKLLYTVTSKNLLLKSLFFLLFITSSEADY